MKTAANSAGVAPITTQASTRRPAVALCDPTPAPSLRCAVLGWDGYGWQLIFANGDEGQARTAAADWLEKNPDSECQLMVAQPEGRAKRVTRVEWGK